MFGPRVLSVAVLCATCGALLVSPSPAAAGPPSTPKSRLLNVWLDLRLLDIFYPETTRATLFPNLQKVARQLKQPLPPLRLGEVARDALRFRAGTVVIKEHPPEDTWILYTRSDPRIWELIDDPGGHLRIISVTAR